MPLYICPLGHIQDEAGMFEPGTGEPAVDITCLDGFHTRGNACMERALIMSLTPEEEAAWHLGGTDAVRTIWDERRRQGLLEAITKAQLSRAGRV